ncbi:MAG TPA: phosphonate C-P lyase system protein PhnH [Caulobacteraceae bacterium]|jgi:alpha-D-ribose 1-methylphosphonate 5-triphosphate synthase subunit PhnH|nr:phosphonate C-P lyase system protein PhnH [Caulobacteraceae bacterium]
MSAALDLDKIRPAFVDPVRESQLAFRKIMEAVARPGTRADFGPAVEPPAGFGVAAATVALTLFDFETAVWLEPALRGGEAETWVRFHCGCPLTTETGASGFAIVTNPGSAPRLGAFNLGDAKYPDRSTTVILQVEDLDGGEAVTLTGPGIKDQAVIAPAGLPEGFWGQVQENNAKFQFGVDVLLVSGPALIAVPRSAQIHIQGG